MEAPAPRDRLIALAVALPVALAYFLTAPKDGDFWNSDAARHAMNGVFLLDTLRAMPLDDPMGFARDYYLRYRALTILFYPPLFYLLEALVFAVAGVNLAAAMATEALFAALLAGAGYRLARLALPPAAAIGFALLIVGGPEMLFWGRQVMLDMPSIAMLVLACWCFAAHCLGQGDRFLYGAAAALLGAVYIKYNAAFLLPAFGLAYVACLGWRALLRRPVWIVVGLTALMLIPAVALNLKFATANLENLASRPGDLQRWSLDAWLFYPRSLPLVAGWAASLLLLPGLAIALARPASRGERVVTICLGAWLLVAGLAISLFSIKETRIGLLLLPPVAFFAVLALTRIPWRRAAAAAPLLLGAGTCAASLFLWPTPVVSGYPAAAAEVARLAPPAANVLFSGYRDGNFIFALRALDTRPDLSVVRADKLLVDVAIARQFGITERDFDETAIAALLAGQGIDLVVAQPGFWADLAVMRRFEAVLRTPAWVAVARFPVTGRLSTQDGREVVLYRLANPPPTRAPVNRTPLRTMGRQLL